VVRGGTRTPGRRRKAMGMTLMPLVSCSPRASAFHSTHRQAR
jgi:hypothetical protein